MTSPDGSSAAPPLRKRKSKRFDRSGVNQRLGASDDAPASGGALPVDPPAPAVPAVEPPSMAPNTAVAEPVAPAAPVSPVAPAAPMAAVVTDSAVRSRTLDERQACGRCGHELSMVNIEVDGNVLVMESCDNCDARRWHLAGEPIELPEVLDHVGEHAGRRR